MHKSPLKSATSLSIMYTASFLLCIVFGFLLLQVGTPDGYINFLMLALLMGGYIFAGMFGKTMQLNIFQTADRLGSSVFIGQSLASGILSSSIFILLAGEFYQGGIDALAIFSGLILGITIMTLLFAAPVNRSKAVTLASSNNKGADSRILKLFIMIIILVTGLLLLNVQFSLIGKISELYFGIAEQTTVILSIVAIGFCLLMGGIQALSISRMLAYPILVISFLTPLAWMSYKLTGNPIPQLSFGVGALETIFEIDQEMLRTGFANETDIFQITREGAVYDSFNYWAKLATIALGTAAMPHLLQHYKTLPTPAKARRTGFWALGFVLIILTAIPAVAIFVKADIYTSLLGLQLGELDDQATWVFALSEKMGVDFITICGAHISSTSQAITACGQPAEYFLSLKDISVNPDLVLLASPFMNELPTLITILLAAGCLFAIWSTADGLVFVMANSLAEDGFTSFIRPKSPMGLRLFVTRFFILIILALAAYLTLNIKLDTRFAFGASFALLTASLFPFLVHQFWIKSLRNTVIGLGIASGFVTTATLLYLGHFGTDYIASNGNELRFGIPYLTTEVKTTSIGILGLCVTLLVTFIANSISKSISKTKSVPADKTTDYKKDVPA